MSLKLQSVYLLTIYEMQSFTGSGRCILQIWQLMEKN